MNKYFCSVFVIRRSWYPSPIQETTIVSLSHWMVILSKLSDVNLKTASRVLQSIRHRTSSLTSQKVAANTVSALNNTCNSVSKNCNVNAPLYSAIWRMYGQFFIQASPLGLHGCANWFLSLSLKLLRYCDRFYRLLRSWRQALVTLTPSHWCYNV